MHRVEHCTWGETPAPDPTVEPEPVEQPVLVDPMNEPIDFTFVTKDINTGVNIPNVLLKITDSETGTITSVYSGQDGMVEYTSMPGRTLFIEAEKSGYLSFSGEITTTTDMRNYLVVCELTPYVIEPIIKETISFRLQALDENTKEPVPGVSFTIQDENGNQIFSGISGDDGIISLSCDEGTTLYVYTQKEGYYSDYGASFTVDLSFKTNETKGWLLTPETSAIERGTVRVRFWNAYSKEPVPVEWCIDTLFGFIGAGDYNNDQAADGTYLFSGDFFINDSVVTYHDNEVVITDVPISGDGALYEIIYDNTFMGWAPDGDGDRTLFYINGSGETVVDVDLYPLQQNENEEAV